MQAASVQMPYQRIYRTRMYSEVGYRLLMLVFWPAWIVFNVIQRAWNHDIPWLAFYVVFLVYMLGTMWASTYLYLLVTPQGVTYSLLGGTLHATWAEAERIEETRHWYGSAVRLVVRGKWRRERWAWWLRWQKPYIPLRAANMLYWQRGVFEDVYTHAPWLFADAPPR